MFHFQRSLAAAALILVLVAGAPTAIAQEPWQPFGTNQDAPPGRNDPLRGRTTNAKPYLAPVPMPGSSAAASEPAATTGPGAQGRDRPQPYDSAPIVMREAGPAPVERGELAPVIANDGSGLPFELWRGLDVAGIEKLISEIAIPPRSPALHDLWQRLVTSDITVSAGDAQNAKFAALRLEALYRSGLTSQAATELAKIAETNDPLLAVFAARTALANGNSGKACSLTQQAPLIRAGMPKAVKLDALLLTGYCSAVSGDAAGAGLAADLAREEGIEQSPGLEALDAIAVKAAPKVEAVTRLGVIDYKLMDLAGASLDPNLLDKAEPALLTAITNDPKSLPEVRLAAAEAAAKLNAIPADALAAIYTTTPTKETADALFASTPTAASPMRRAALFKAAESEKTPMRKTRLIRALIDDSRASGLAFHAMRMAARAAAEVKAEPELGWFAETASEIGLASGNYDMTRRWVAASASEQGSDHSLAHWLALADIADPASGTSGQHLRELEALALRSRFSPDALHRLATVLDALNYIVPIPLWEAASRTPQPSAGYLPETGVLAELRDAAKAREFGHTVLLVMKTLGPDGAEGANIIALGDSIRALKRAGLETEARRLGLEALLATWPRTAVN